MDYFDDEVRGVQITLTKEPTPMPIHTMLIVGIDSKGETYEFCVDKKNYHVGDKIGVFGNVVYGDLIPTKVRKIS